MSDPAFLIVDGYPKASRDQFTQVGMTWAGKLYEEMLHRYLPNVPARIWYVQDDPAPSQAEFKAARALLWPGCNQTVYHDNAAVNAMVGAARTAYDAGVPQFGSCWGIQVAAFAAGGSVEAHPKGREMGLGRNIALTDEGRTHPMMKDKAPVFTHFVSHDDQVTKLPPGAVRLAGNDWSPVQAAVFKRGKGEFWAVQYHPEYDLHQLARLIVAREARLIKGGMFRDHPDVMAYVDKLEALHADPKRTDLRWQLGISDDLIVAANREREFANWVATVIKPG